MSSDAVNKFFEKVAQEPTLKASVASAASLGGSALGVRLVEIASKAGFQVSGEDAPLLTKLSAQIPGSGELSDKDLDMSGGDGGGTSYPNDPRGGMP